MSVTIADSVSNRILFFSFNAFWAREASMILGLPSWEAGLNFLWFFLPSVSKNLSSLFAHRTLTDLLIVVLAQTFATPVVGWASQRYKEVKLSLATGFSLFVVGSSEFSFLRGCSLQLLC